MNISDFPKKSENMFGMNLTVIPFQQERIPVMIAMSSDFASHTMVQDGERVAVPRSQPRAL